MSGPRLRVEEGPQSGVPLGWREVAACKHMEGDWVTIPENMGLPSQRKLKAMEIAVCQSCDVRGDCLRYANQSRQRYGIWGGRLPKERRGRYEPKV